LKQTFQKLTLVFGKCYDKSQLLSRGGELIKMAQFLKFKCSKCDKEFELKFGVTMSGAGAVGEEINQQTRKNLEKLFNDFQSHTRECKGGLIVLEDLGFLD
jgi:transposase-like protein